MKNQVNNSDDYESNQIEISETVQPQTSDVYKNILESISDPVFKLDKYLRFTFWNKACQDRIGVSASMVLGKYIEDIFPDKGFCATETLINAFETGKAIAHRGKVNISNTICEFDFKIYPDREGLTILAFEIFGTPQSEHLLAKEKERLELALWAAELGSWDWNIANNQLCFDNQFAKLHGFSNQEVKNDVKFWKDRIHPKDLKRSEKLLKDHMDGKSNHYRAEVRFKNKNGKWRWMLDTGKVVERDQDGKAIRMVGVHFDIHKKKEMDNLLLQRKQHIELAIESANLASWDWDIKTNKVYRNGKCEELFGHHPDEEVTLEFLTHPDDKPKVKAALKAHLKGETKYYFCEHRIRHASGNWVWTYASGKVIKWDKNGNPERMIGLQQDLTYLKQAEEAVRIEKERLELTVNSAGIGLWEWNVPEGITIINEKLGNLLGYTAEEYKQQVRHWIDRVVPEDYPGVYEKSKALLAGKTNQLNTEIRLRAKTGEIRWFLVNGKVVERDEKDDPVRMVGIMMDISPIKNMEQSLREQKEQMELIFWAADLGSWDIKFDSHDPIKNSVQINEQTATMLGYSKAEFGEILGGEDWTSIYHPDDRDRVLSLIEKHFSNETNYFRAQHRNRMKNGDYKWIMNTGKIVERDELGRPLRFSGVQQDISEIKKVESSLYLFQSLLDKSQDPAYGLDPHRNFQIVFVNEAACKHFGYSREELLSMSIAERDLKMFDFYSVVSLEEIKRNKSFTYETEHRHQNGKTIPVEVTANYLVHHGKELITGYIKDISERKANEKQIREINNQLEQRVKERTAELEAANKELEAFSYSVSHDLRAPLRSIDGFSNALMVDYFDILDEEGKDFLGSIRNATSYMGTLIDDMLNLSKVTRAELFREKVDISRLAENIIQNFSINKPNRQVRVKITADMIVEGDFHLLNIALTNLLENAWKFTGEKQVAQIEFGCKQVDNQIVYFIKDNGAGFDMEYVHKLFGAFQRLHHTEEFEGTGIGLATVQRIINRHGGKIWAEGEVDRGATFYFTLN